MPPIPAKRYFTIGEVSELCGVKPHVLRYWEQEFTQLKPVKRRGNRRYYQREDVLTIRQIRGLLYDQGYTSIGCAPCTAKPLDPNDPRSGRWAGQGKIECGIHIGAEGTGVSGDGGKSSGVKEH